MELEKERIVLAEIFSHDGKVGIHYPNGYDVNAYEVLGFMRCYVKSLEQTLIDELEMDDDE